MKKSILLLLLATFSLSCDKKEQIDSLYKKYESELIQGNTIKAEEYLDKIIKLDSDNPKYFKLKITLLVNNCKKNEAIKIIDKILITDKQDVDLIMLKILLLPDNDTQKQDLIKKIDLLLEQKMEKKSIQRNQIIINLILIKKLQNVDENDIIKVFKKFNLTEDEENIFRDNINLSREEISNITPQCK